MTTPSEVGSCIACASSAVRLFLDLGRTALANKFIEAAELSTIEPTYPLRVGFCQACGHVQLMDFVPPSAMFDDYLYVSAASDTLRAHLHELSDVVVGRFRPGPSDLVVDIGCNDGTLLQGFARHGVRTLGVDPAQNLARLLEGNGIERFTGYFGARTAEQIVQRWGKASVVTATNTFPHIPDLPDFLEGIRTVLAPGGVFVIEAHYLLDMLEQVAFDTIYHEHVSYWALGPMVRLFQRHGLEAVSAERLPIHHGQVRVAVQRKDEAKVEASVGQVLEREAAHGLDRYDTFERFAERSLGIKRDLRRTLDDLRSAGNRIAGYGAPAKGSTLLGFLEIGPDVLDYIADRSPLKQGRYTPGTHVPIVSTERLLADAPEYVLLLAWNFVDEILAQQAEYRAQGGRFIVPVPEVRIIESPESGVATPEVGSTPGRL